MEPHTRNHYNRDKIIWSHIYRLRKPVQYKVGPKASDSNICITVLTYFKLQTCITFQAFSVRKRHRVVIHLTH